MRPLFEVSVNESHRIYLQGDKMFENLYAFKVLWVLVHVGVNEECLQGQEGSVKMV